MSNAIYSPRMARILAAQTMYAILLIDGEGMTQVEDACSVPPPAATGKPSSCSKQTALRRMRNRSETFLAISQ